METSILSLCYLIGSVSFIIGLKMLSHPETARRGNQVSAMGMGIAILGTLLLYRTGDGQHLHNYGWMAGALVIGAVIGTRTARTVKMTAMPELVSIFNGMGGLCAALISTLEFGRWTDGDAVLRLLIILAGALIGSISFAGSMVAYGKLSGKVKDHSFPGQHIVNLVVLAVIVILIVGLLWGITGVPAVIFYIILLLSLSYGVFFRAAYRGSGYARCHLLSELSYRRSDGFRRVPVQ